MKRSVLTIFLLSLLLNCISTQGAQKEYPLNKEKDGTQWQLFSEHGYYGVKNGKGKVIIPARYNSVQYEYGGFSVKDNSHHVGKYTKKGKLIFPPFKYSQAHLIVDLEESPYIVVGNRYGLLNHKGEILLEDEYTNIKPYGNQKTDYYFLLWKNGYMGAADRKGNIIIPPDKHNIVGFHCSEDGKVIFNYLDYGKGSGAYNRKGEKIIGTDYNMLIPKWEGNEAYFEVSDGNATGRLDYNGNVISPIGRKAEASIMEVESEGNKFSIWRSEKNKYYVKNSNGETIISPDYDMIGFYKDCFTLWNGRYMGLANNKGEILVPTDKNYIAIGPMNNYIIATTPDQKDALFDYTGKSIHPAVHEKMLMDIIEHNETRDTILYHRDAIGCWGAKSMKGKTIVEPEYDEIEILNTVFGLYFVVSKDGKKGLQDYDGQIIIEPEFKKITASTNIDFPFFFINSGYMGVADVDGNIVIQPEIFEKISFSPKTKKYTGTAGKRICVFNQEGKLLSDNQKHVEKEENIEKADIEFNKGNYKKAVEYYSKAIQLSAIPSASLYFNRGVSYYNNNKYYEAIADFKRTLDSRPSERLRDRAIDLIGKAEHYQEVKEQNQMQLASAIFGLAMTGVNIALQASSKKTSSYSGSGRTSNSSSTSYHRDDEGNDDDTATTGRKKQKCGRCGGRGSTVEYSANYGIDENPWCDDCGKKVTSGHYHRTCTNCNGTGER